MTEINLDNPKLYEYIVSPDKQITEDDTENEIEPDIQPIVESTKNENNKNKLIIFIIILLIAIFLGYIYLKKNNNKIEQISTYDTRIRISK